MFPVALRAICINYGLVKMRPLLPAELKENRWAQSPRLHRTHAKIINVAFEDIYKLVNPILFTESADVRKERFRNGDHEKQASGV